MTLRGAAKSINMQIPISKPYTALEGYRHNWWQCGWETSRDTLIT